MKLAEALILRADYQKRIEQLRARITRNAKVQEGDPPAEDPAALLRQLNEIVDDLQRLIQNINRTNAATALAAGGTIADAIAERDLLSVRHATYRDLAQAATVTQERYSKSEVKFQSTVDVAAMQRQADDYARQHRELDARLQEANWQVDLIE